MAPLCVTVRIHFWKSYDTYISDIKIIIDNIFDVFCYNNFKENPSKCYLFLSPFIFINLNSLILKVLPQKRNFSGEKLVDSNFTFKKPLKVF